MPPSKLYARVLYVLSIISCVAAGFSYLMGSDQHTMMLLLFGIFSLLMILAGEKI